MKVSEKKKNTFFQSMPLHPFFFFFFFPILYSFISFYFLVLALFLSIHAANL